MKPPSPPLYFGVTLGIVLISAQVSALDPNTTDARAIAAAVEDRESGNRSVSRVTLTLMDASGRKRVRKVQQMSKDFSEGNKTLIFFESPGDVRNTGLLSIDYDDSNRNDDQWLYLPSLHKSTRISGSDKSGSFMGTDLTYSDMTKKDTDGYVHKILEASTKIDGQDCWLIESRPKSDKEKQETGYLKTHVWISKTMLLPMQTKAWVIEGKKLKYMKSSKFEKVDGIWIAKELAVRTVRNKRVESQTLMEIGSIKFNQAQVTDDQFTERRLEQGI